MLVCAPGATSLGRVPDKNWQTTFDLLTMYLQSAEGQADRRLLHQRFPAGQRAEVPDSAGSGRDRSAAVRGSRRRFDRGPRASASGSPARTRNVHRARGRVVRHTGRRIREPDRPLGLRQEHADADHGRTRSRRASGEIVVGGEAAAAAADRRRHRVPGSPAARVSQRARQRAAAARRFAGCRSRRRARRLRASWASSAFPSPRATAIRASCRAACGSACRSRAR